MANGHNAAVKKAIRFLRLRLPQILAICGVCFLQTARWQSVLVCIVTLLVECRRRSCKDNIHKAREATKAIPRNRAAIHSQPGSSSNSEASSKNTNPPRSKGELAATLRGQEQVAPAKPSGSARLERTTQCSTSGRKRKPDATKSMPIAELEKAELMAQRAETELLELLREEARTAEDARRTSRTKNGRCNVTCGDVCVREVTVASRKAGAKKHDEKTKIAKPAGANGQEHYLSSSANNRDFSTSNLKEATPQPAAKEATPSQKQISSNAENGINANSSCKPVNKPCTAKSLASSKEFSSSTGQGRRRHKIPDISSRDGIDAEISSQRDDTLRVVLEAVSQSNELNVSRMHCAEVLHKTSSPTTAGSSSSFTASLPQSPDADSANDEDSTQDSIEDEEIVNGSVHARIARSLSPSKIVEHDELTTSVVLGGRLGQAFADACPKLHDNFPSACTLGLAEPETEPELGGATHFCPKETIQSHPVKDSENRVFANNVEPHSRPTAAICVSSGTLGPLGVSCKETQTHNEIDVGRADVPKKLALDRTQQPTILPSFDGKVLANDLRSAFPAARIHIGPPDKRGDASLESESASEGGNYHQHFDNTQQLFNRPTDSLGPLPVRAKFVSEIETTQKAALWRDKLRQQGAAQLIAAEASMPSRQSKQDQPRFRISSETNGVPRADEVSMSWQPFDNLCAAPSHLAENVAPHVHRSGDAGPHGVEFTLDYARLNHAEQHFPELRSYTQIPGCRVPMTSHDSAKPWAVAEAGASMPFDFPIRDTFSSQLGHTIDESGPQTMEYQNAYNMMYQGILRARLEAAAPDHYED